MYVLPSNDDALQVLAKGTLIAETHVDVSLLQVNDICVSLWIGDNEEKLWYIGYCLEVDEEHGEYVVDHLNHVNQSSN